MSKHIGIVGCSAEGAALCYRTICQEAGALLGQAHAHPEVSLHTPSLADYMQCLEVGDLEGVGALMLDSARKLQTAGADFLICPDNTIHQAMKHVLPDSPLPWIQIADAVAEHAVARGYGTLALTGTKWLVASEVYPKALSARGLGLLRPDVRSCEAMTEIIMDELVQGIFSDRATAFFQDMIAGFKEQGAEAVILGCTEIPLIIDDTNSMLPTLDSTRLLARAAIRRAIEEHPVGRALAP